MKIITCPLNGPRNASEFVCAGPLKRPPPAADPADPSGDRAWADYLFGEDNRAGVVFEWWCHIPSSYWFIVERDTRTEKIIGTYAPGEPGDLFGAHGGPKR